MDNFTLAMAGDVVNILQAVRGNRPVVRLMDGKPFDGTAYRICGPSGTIAERDADVRDLFLAVNRHGAPYYWPIRDLLTEANAGTFMVGSPILP